ncbi:DUF3558 family protein [Nocardiopsis sp. MG754419]|uniref:DUF3558 family protein n=1 Tax=Nocardiopsis sp. MG754419 TaxID=2259865 RepID=UPI001BA48B33|nr:DUF3558 family protein [Nocardiopsis sp. MG754419]MBR8740671.1 DUF3558 domain-containing protein [Nocardiopsis sp. MG754419]
MRAWRGVAVAVTAVLVGGCGGEIEPADRDSIDQFDVPALDPTAQHPCDLLPDATAVDLGLLEEGGSGSRQSDANCFFTNAVDSSVDVWVETYDPDTEEDGAPVVRTLAAAFEGGAGHEYVTVEGYPGHTETFPDSCNLDVALSDEHSLFVQVSADDACQTAVLTARALITASPER